jgi:hypothetical protein
MVDLSNIHEEESICEIADFMNNINKYEGDNQLISVRSLESKDTTPSRKKSNPENSKTKEEYI